MNDASTSVNNCSDVLATNCDPAISTDGIVQGLMAYTRPWLMWHVIQDAGSTPGVLNNDLSTAGNGLLMDRSTG